MSVKRSALNVERSGAAGPSSAATAAVDADNPWPGLASFTEDTSAFFFGREKETEELVRLIRRHTLTVLFGQSGLGKSSLLQAGAFPPLREADLLPLYLRLDHAPESLPLAEQVKSALAVAFASARADAPAFRADETLWEYFHRKDIDIWSAKNRLLTPILAFDQFEEIFTLGRADEARRERGRAFLTELADLVENRPPATLRAKFDAGELDPGRYNFDKPSCQVVISLREDFLPDLEGLKNEMRSILHNRMRVKRLNGTQALEIVQRPAPHLIAEGVAERIVEFVAGARGGSAERLAEMEVEPALLSVICRELNERRRALGQDKIMADLVSGNRREILNDFYERSVADLPEAVRTFVEDHLLTKSGFRDNLALETALDFPGVTRPRLDTLVSRRLLRIEDRLGVQRVELTHDVLAEVIRASRDSHQQLLAVEQLRERERVTRRRMWLARIIAAGLLVGMTGVSWVAWRAIRAEREQTRLHAEADTLRARADKLREQAAIHELAARQKAYASDMNLLKQSLDMDALGRAQTLLNRQRPLPGQRDLRGWEWRYLWQFSQSDAQSVLSRKASPISSLAASHDGKWLAVGELRQGGLSVWNLQTREETRVPAGDGFVFAAFSPREPLLAIATTNSSAAAGGRNRVLLWNATTRQTVREIVVGSQCAKLAFSADGQTLVTLTRDPRGQIALWRVSDGNRLAGFPMNPAAVAGPAVNVALAIVPDLSVAAHAAPGGKVSVIDLASGREKWTARATHETVVALAFSPDGKILASGAGTSDPVIRLWDAASGREIRRLEGHRTFVQDLVFWPDGKTLASASADQTIRLWDASSGRLTRTLRGHTDEVFRLTLLPDNRTLASGSEDGVVCLWDSEKTRAAGAMIKLPKPIVAWRFAPDSKSVLSVDAQGRVERWRGAGFQEKDAVVEIAEVDSEPLTANDVQLAADCPLLAVGFRNGQVKIWDYERRVLMREFKTSDRRVLPVAFLGQGKRLIIMTGGQANATLHEWDLIAGTETRSWRGLGTGGGGVGAVAFSQDERWFLRLARTATGELKSSLRNLVTGNETSPNLKLDNVPGAAFSPDGRLIAGSSNSGYFRLWDAATFREVATISDFLQGARSPVFSPDGRRLVVASTGREAVKLWDVESLENLLTLEGDGFCRGTLFSPDGNVLGVVSSVPGFPSVLHLWRAPSWEEIEKAEVLAAQKP